MFRLGKIFCRGTPPVKGKFLDTRFGLIHVETGKKNFAEGPPTPPSKGKIFDTRFGLIHVQTGKKFFCWGTSPLVKGKIFDTRFWLDTCSDQKKFFHRGTPPNGIARTCYGYAVGGMPLVFMQEDFLVKLNFLISLKFNFQGSRNVIITHHENFWWNLFSPNHSNIE